MPGTARGYADAVRPFLTGHEGADGLRLEDPTAGDVTAFVLATYPAMPVTSAIARLSAECAAARLDMTAACKAAASIRGPARRNG